MLFTFSAQMDTMETTMKRHKRRSSAAPAVAAKRIAVDFPKQLLDQAERATRELAINRSELIRLAVEQFVESLHRAKLEQELAEGYQANARLDRTIADEFASVDYDTF